MESLDKSLQNLFTTECGVKIIDGAGNSLVIQDYSDDLHGPILGLKVGLASVTPLFSVW